ncbi:MAG: hypothetical protein EOP10_05180 [Proteobacteria bacterium]|nr:MAG: hypothetical protein EOP10_05180 [Pseudomonadota bacterium]
MTPFLYWPYDEVTLDRPAEGNVAEVKTPWLSARVTFKEDDREKIERLAGKFADHSLSAQDIELINWFFGELDHYSFCYIVPAPKEETALDQHELRDAAFVALPFTDFLTTSAQESKEFASADAQTVTDQFKQRDWSWDAKAALEFAQLGGKIHPESLFTVVRRFHLLDVLEKDDGKQKFAFIESLKGPEFARAASLLVRQNHYVTQKCQEALLPAVKTAGRAKPLVEAFVKEENGHDLILNVALKALTPDPQAVPVSLQTKAIMHLLKFAAERNFFAFAMAIDFFERSSYEDIDPLAQLLIKGGFDKAAKQINRHMEINDAGGHENVACSFLESMAPCDPAYALEALRIAEMLSLVMNSITSSAIDLYHQA